MMGVVDYLDLLILIYQPNRYQATEKPLGILNWRLWTQNRGHINCSIENIAFDLYSTEFSSAFALSTVPETK